MAARDNSADGRDDGYLEYLSRQLTDLSLAHDRQFVAQLLRLKESAERGMYLAREHLIQVAVALCPAWVDDLSKADPWGGVRKMPLDQLAEGIIAQVKRRIMTLEWRALPETEQDVAALRAEVAALRQERTQLLGRAAQLELENARLTTQIAQLSAPGGAGEAGETPPNLPASASGVSPETPEVLEAPPAGSPAWTPPADSAAAALLRLIVAGESRRPRLRAALAEALGLAASSTNTNSVRKAFRALEEAGLVERLDVALAGNPMLYLPTDAGLAAYRALHGEPPAATSVRALLARHRSPEHTYLNLETADLLRALGHTVDMTPPEVRDERGHFVPDLLAVSPDGETLYVEVETGAGHHSVAQAARKWRVIADHTGACIRAVCATDAALAGVRAAVEYLAEAYGGRLDAAAGVLDAMAKGAAPGVDLDDLWAWRRVFAEKEPAP